MESTKGAAPVAVLGVDVGKASHWACALTAAGEVAFSGPLPNRAEDVDGLLARAGRQALVVVDQARDIGSLVVRRAQLAGNAVAYLPGLAMSRARDMLPGAAKTDRIDAEVIARAALGMPRSLRPVPAESELKAALRALSARREASARARSAEVNRLRAGLLELDPALEAALDPSKRWQLGALAEFGSPSAAAAAGTRAWRQVAERGFGARREASDALLGAMRACDAAGRGGTAAEALALRASARNALALGDQVDELDREIASLLADDETYRCLLTVPGVGPKAAAALVTMVDVSMFRSHDELASYCGLAPADRQSGTSVRSSSAQRGGNKRLKDVMVFSCLSLLNSEGRYTDYYRACRARGMCHNKALKATARKRMKVIFAVMRDKVPYKE